MKRRLWLIALCLYAIAMLADVGVHFAADRHANSTWLTPANLAVAFSASLFWPVDLVAKLLLSR